MISFTGFCLFFSLFLTTLIISTSSYASINPTIDINPEILTKSGDSVRISWNGIESPSDFDWLGIYSPPNSSHSNFIGYIFLSNCEGWRSGSGSIDLPLINIRSNYEFRIFRGNLSEIGKEKLDDDHNALPVIGPLLARSGEVGFVNFNAPAQIHLSFTENESEMRVLFSTKDGLKSWVKYGRYEDDLDRIVETESRTYGRSDMCDSPANSDVGWRDPGFVHDGVMMNLKPGKRYYYQVGSDAGGWSEIHRFISRDVDSHKTTAFLLGDMGTSVPYRTFLRTQEESLSTVKWILRDIEDLGHKPSFVSHVGDISYARGYSWLWDSFFTQIEPIASKVPYHVCIGNHEYDWPLQPWKPSWASTVYGKDGGGECGVPYSLKFNMPGNSSEPTGNGSPATRNLYYSFNNGVVHFLYFSTETNFLPGSDQYEFIKRDLETVDREETPFVVVQGHRPMYTTCNRFKEASLREKMLEHLEPLLVKNRVNLVLWGHVHRYERFCPLRNYTCGSLDPNTDSDLPIHVVIGMGGQDSQPLWEQSSDNPTPSVFPQPEQSLYRGGEFGYVRLVATRKKLTLTYIGNHDGNAHDTVVIKLNEKITAAAAVDSIINISSSIVKSVSLWVLGALLCYVGVYMYYAGRKSEKKSWIAVRTDEV